MCFSFQFSRRLNFKSLGFLFYKYISDTEVERRFYSENSRKGRREMLRATVPARILVSKTPPPPQSLGVSTPSNPPLKTKTSLSQSSHGPHRCWLVVRCLLLLYSLPLPSCAVLHSICNSTSDVFYISKWSASLLSVGRRKP